MNLVAGLFDAYPKVSSTKMKAGLFDAFFLLEIGTYMPSSVDTFPFMVHHHLKMTFENLENNVTPGFLPIQVFLEV